MEENKEEKVEVKKKTRTTKKKEENSRVSDILQKIEVEEKKQTKTKTNEPVWNETFDIYLPEDQITTKKEIYFHIWSQGIVKESIGRLTIEVQTSNIEEQWYMLNLERKWNKNSYWKRFRTVR